MQRFQCAVWPDVSSDFELIDELPEPESIRQVNQIFTRLSQPEPELKVHRFTPEAQEKFNYWLKTHETNLRKDDIAESIEAHLGKYASLVPSIALVLHLCEGHQGRALAIGFSDLRVDENDR